MNQHLEQGLYSAGQVRVRVEVGERGHEGVRAEVRRLVAGGLHVRAYALVPQLPVLQDQSCLLEQPDLKNCRILLTVAKVSPEKVLQGLCVWTVKLRQGVQIQDRFAKEFAMLRTLKWTCTDSATNKRGLESGQGL